MQRKDSFSERQPRFGVEPEKIEECGIDLSRSICRATLSPEEQVELEIIAIINISIGGIKIIVSHTEQIHSAGQKLEVVFPTADREYKLVGKLAWAENTAIGQHWFGIELRLSADALELFKSLTGEEIK